MDQDTFLMEAETLFYESLSKINNHNHTLNQSSIDINFSDTSSVSEDVRKAFYKFLDSHITTLNSLKAVYESIFELHGVNYKD